MAFDKTNRINAISVLKNKLNAFLEFVPENDLSFVYINFVRADVQLVNVAEETNTRYTILDTYNRGIGAYIDTGYIYNVPMSSMFDIEPETTYETFLEDYKIKDEIEILNDVSLTSEEETKITDALTIILEDMYYFTKEKDTDGNEIKVSYEVILNMKGLRNYITKYIENLDLEYSKYQTATKATQIQETIADLFNLKKSFDNQDTKYAGMVGEFFIGFGLLTEDTKLPPSEKEKFQVAPIDKLDRIYKNWRDVTNIESKSYTTTTNETTTTHYYSIYRLDYDKTMALPPSVLVPLISLFVTSYINEKDHCEYDQLIVFVIQVVLIIVGAEQVAFYLGEAYAIAYVMLSIISMSGVGSEDFQLATKVALIAISAGTAYESMSVGGITTLETLSFSVSLADGIFSTYANYDLNKDIKELESKEKEIEELEDELNLLDTQDRILTFIYDEQYTDIYNTMYNIDDKNSLFNMYD